ncbi:hypothetical protein [Rhodococcus sp. IEGM 1408]|uniref:hypothetical protein n=1 Tax=Rhodococcus sp. IEGM 1408 TaxID=3082220 RepID=UPI00295474A4|nr:hypothetical protein [Rhodococcus sp. IEGM 1408]MDV7999819.1 hypothetical protein [Rhodococcus sp. IEGM 1408]
MTETTPSDSPEGYGNTVDGSRAGDGSDDARTTPGDGQSPSDNLAESPEQPTGHQHGDQQRAEQKKVYQTPEQTDHALGGSEGTADGS